MSSDRFLAPAMGVPAIAAAAASATADAPVVTLDGITKRFRNGTLALDHFDLTVRAGEFLSLLGPSGCGKSTALRLIAGLGEPDGRPHCVGHGRERRRSQAPAQRARCRLRVPGTDLDAVGDGSAQRNAAARNSRACRVRLRSSAPPRRWSGSASRLRGCLSARTLRRHEDAGLDRPRAGHRSAAAADGRAVRGTRRDHPVQAQQRSARAVAGGRPHGHFRHPFGVRVGLPVAAGSW